MWVLIISLYLHQPLGQTQSKGVIQAPQPSYETCLREKDRIRETWYTDGYKVSPRCIYIKHYSKHNYSF
jgi:hypothetical protein